MKTVSQSEAGFWDLLEAFQAISAELARFDDAAALADAALQLALELTHSTVAFIALTSEGGDDQQVFSRSASPADALPPGELQRIVEATASRSGPAPSTIAWNDSSQGPVPFQSYVGHPLKAGGKTIGMIGIASPNGYPATQRRAFSIFANQVAAGLEIALLEERRRKMVDTLVNLREDLDRSERQRLINEERAQSAERVEQAHEAAVAALHAVSGHARSGRDLLDFYRGLTVSIAGLVGAKKVLFWQLNGDGTLTAIGGGHGIDEAFLNRLYPAPCAPERDDVASHVVFHDHVFRASRADADGTFGHVLDALDVTDALAVCWRAGDQRLGLVAAYESIREDGFTREDGWVLQKAALASGLVWQLKHAEVDLQKTVERLERIDAARQLLLKNMSTAVEKTRKRFAAELHDDALQKLTAAELQLQRLREPNGRADELLKETQGLLAQTEDALRRMLFEVRPPALEMPGGFEETIRDRVTMLKAMTGIDADVQIELPDEVPYEMKSMLFRQVTEALTNVERHSAATRVEVSVKAEGRAVHGLVIDNGRGFVVADRDHLPGHLGLLALNERSLLAGGWTKIESAPGAGTRVEFWMPVE
ncbi:MAG TPA: GAF domain-containing protein [Candidatus Dormibacteraeota bacterium]